MLSPRDADLEPIEPNKIQNMKITSTLLLSALALGATPLLTLAQEPPAGGGGGRPPGGGPGGPGGRPVPPMMAALDTNKDGELDATEIANATAALKTLDKNGDGKLTNDELRPPRGERGGPGGGGQGGPRPGGQGGGGGGRPGGQ